jgi:hypothetical protein
MNKEQVQIAVSAGLELLGSESTTLIPVRLNDGVFLLKQLLVAIAQGRIGLSNTTQAEAPAPSSPQVAEAVKKAVEQE